MMKAGVVGLISMSLLGTNAASCVTGSCSNDNVPCTKGAPTEVCCTWSYFFHSYKGSVSIKGQTWLHAAIPCCKGGDPKNCEKCTDNIFSPPPECTPTQEY